MSITPEFGFVLEYVPDVAAAMRFYVELLGLRVERYHPTFVQFSNFAIASDEAMGGGRGPEIYWIVDDTEAAVKDLSQKAEVVVPLKQMPFGKVFGIKDPAGKPLYLWEPVQDRPSRPVK